MGWYGDSSSGGWYGSSGGGKPGKPKKPKGKSVGGFFGNLVDDIQGTATSLVPGLVNAGSSLIHDAGKTVGLAKGPYRSDDLLGAILDSYTDKGTFWGELARGLDASLMGDPFSGATWDRAGKHFGRMGGAFYKNPFGPMLDIASLVTMGGGAAAKGASLMGKGADAAKLTYRVGRPALNAADGAATLRYFDRTLSKNPVIRTRQRAFEKLSEAAPDNMPILGVEKRLARHDARLAKRADMRREAAETRGLRNAIAGLRGAEADAVHLLAGDHDVNAVIAHYRNRLGQVDAEIGRKKAAGIKRGKKSIKVDDAGNVKRADLDEDMAYEGEGLKSLLDADMRDSLRDNVRNRGAIEVRIKKLERVRDSGVLDAPSKKVQAAVDEARKVAAISTQRLRESNVVDDASALQRMALESGLMKLTGAVDEPYIGATRSHIRAVPYKKDARGNAPSGPRWTKPGKLAEAQRNTGYNAWNALDDISPRAYLKSYESIAGHTKRVERFKTLVSKSDRVTPAEAGSLQAAGTHRIVDKTSELGKQIDQVTRVLQDAGDVIDDAPMLKEIAEGLDEAFGVKGDGLVPVVPKAYYNELVGDFHKASAFVRVMIDTPTRVWRALTLNMRPAWIVNNFVGQMFLLAIAHGSRGIANYFKQFGSRGRLVDELAPELADFGWAHDAANDLAGLGGNKVTRGMKRMSDAMGNLNAKLTDDHTRKAAFLSTIDPHVKRMMKERPDLSYEDAARELWKNEKIADEVTSQVLSDMIDFGDLSDFERRYVKRAIPFYAWISGMTRRTVRLIADEPWKVAVGYRISEQGARDVEERFGELPPFLRGMVGLPGANVLMTQGANPFMTSGDVAGMTAGAFLPGRTTGAQNPLAQLNPVMKAPLEALANRDFFYGRELDPKGETSFAGRMMGQVGNSFAQKRVIDEWLQQREMESTGLEYDPLFTPSLKNALASYFGVPIRTLDIQAANARALREATQK